MDEESMTENGLEGLMPEDPIMAGAWVGSLRYALGRADVRAAFRADTGIARAPGKTPVDRMIDEATGADFAFVKAFARWHSQNIRGEEAGEPIDAPVDAADQSTLSRASEVR